MGKRQGGDKGKSASETMRVERRDAGGAPWEPPQQRRSRPAAPLAGYLHMHAHAYTHLHTYIFFVKIQLFFFPAVTST